METATIQSTDTTVEYLKSRLAFLQSGMQERTERDPNYDETPEGEQMSKEMEMLMGQLYPNETPFDRQVREGTLSGREYEEMREKYMGVTVRVGVEEGSGFLSKNPQRWNAVAGKTEGEMEVEIMEDSGLLSLEAEIAKLDKELAAQEAAANNNK